MRSENRFKFLFESSNRSSWWKCSKPKTLPSSIKTNISLDNTPHYNSLERLFQVLKTFRPMIVFYHTQYSTQWDNVMRALFDADGDGEEIVYQMVMYEDIKGPSDIKDLMKEK